MAVADALTRHVLGTGNPSASLMDHGQFPPNWVEEYCRLLALVDDEWGTAAVWPRHMVGALHYALTHLRVRYTAWQSFKGGMRNENTERELSRVEGPTRILFARAFLIEEPKHAGSDAAAGPGE